jgi:hypothetical protein
MQKNMASKAKATKARNSVSHYEIASHEMCMLRRRDAT